jgi:hypothetical protein
MIRLKNDIGSKYFFRTALAFLFFFLSMISLFSISTPVFAGPDDDYHLASIWCAEGQKSEMCTEFTEDEYTTYGKIPGDLSGLLACKSRDISVSINCRDYADTGVATLTRINDGFYPNVFYRFFNTFVSQDALNSIVMMRLINSCVLFLLVCFAIFLLPIRSSIKIMQFFFLLMVPFPLFLMGTNNPQTWSVTLITPLYFIISNALGDFNLRKNMFLILENLYYLIATFMVIGSRGDGIYLILFLIVIVCLINLKHLNRLKILMVGFWIVIAFVLNNAFGPKTLSLASSNMESEGRSFTFHNILELPGFLLGVFGGRGDSGYLGLGSYDLPLPSISWVATALSIIIILAAGYNSTYHKFAFASGLFGVAFICIYGMNQQNANTAGFFQPRYILGFLIITLLVGMEKNIEGITQLKYFSVLLLTIIGYVSFTYAVVLRYSSGIRVESSEYLQLFAAPNTYVSKSLIHWEWFSGSLQGLYSLNSTFIFILMIFLTLCLTITLYLMREFYLRLDSVSQRNTIFGVNPLSKSN